MLLAWNGAMAQKDNKAANQPRDWENPHVLGVNKLPYHATLQLPSKEAECKEIVSLDGQWQFHWSKDPESRPVGFERDDYDVSRWDKITVPGNWQLQACLATGSCRASVSLSMSICSIRSIVTVRV